MGSLNQALRETATLEADLKLANGEIRALMARCEQAEAERDATIATVSVLRESIDRAFKRLGRGNGRPHPNDIEWTREILGCTCNPKPVVPPQSFLDYMAFNYPPGSIITSSAWHADRIWRAAMRHMP